MFGLLQSLVLVTKLAIKSRTTGQMSRFVHVALTSTPSNLSYHLRLQLNLEQIILGNRLTSTDLPGAGLTGATTFLLHTRK